MSKGVDNLVRAVREFGIVGTWKKLYQLRTVKFGKVVGIDKFGNKYYENKEYAAGHHRWVEYTGGVSFYEADGSTIPAEWHLWLTHTTEDPPTEKTVGSTHIYKPHQILTHSDAPYERNLGGVIADHTPNMSHMRPRGYGVGNGLTGPIGSAPHQEGAYTQPGHTMDKRNPKGSREVGWTLKDTLTSFERREKLALASDGHLTRAEISELLDEGESGTFATSDDTELTAEEQKFLEDETIAWNDEDAIRNLEEHILFLQGVIKEYESVNKPRLTEKPLQAAKAELSETEHKFNMCNSISQKMKLAQQLM